MKRSAISGSSWQFALLVVCCLLGLQSLAWGYAVTNFPGNFVLASSPITGSGPDGVALADVNGDGKPDLIVANSGSDTLEVLTNAGGGIFVSNTVYTTPVSPTFVVTADVNGDGKLDLIYSSSANNTLTVLTNNGSGIFGSNATYTVAGPPNQFVAADVNGDGKPDLIVAGYSSDEVTVLTNNGNGTFTTSAILGTGGYASWVTVADLNHDGRPDLAVANYYQSSDIVVFTNAGSGTFSNATTVTASGNNYGLAAAGVYGNGQTDLISSGYTSGFGSSIYILKNNGNSTFTRTTNYAVENLPVCVVAADLNGDGKLDVVTANSNYGTLSELTNNGSGGFVLITNLPVGTTPDFVVVADINGDGNPDLISVNNGNNTLSVLTNAPVFSYPLQISGFSPTNGIVGSSVVINGPYNFSTVTSVLFNGQSAAFTVNSDTQITATVPSCAGTGPISVMSASYTATTTSNFQTLKQSVTVSSTNESSLDYAICNGSNVTFSVSGQIGITSPLVISSDITLDGTGQTLTISGNHGVGIFIVGAGVHLTLKNLTIANGMVSTAGAGIYNNGGLVTVINCTFSNNVVLTPGGVNPGQSGGDGGGGGIFNTNGGTVILTGSTFCNNSAEGGYGNLGYAGSGEGQPGQTGGNGGSGYGGALDNSGGTISVTNCTFYENAAFGASGGGGGSGYNGSTYSYACGTFCCHYDFFGDCNETCEQYCTGTIPGGAGGQGGTGGNAYGGNIYNSSGNVTLVNVTFADGVAVGGTAGSGGTGGAYGPGNGSAGSIGSGAGGNMGQAGGQFLCINTIVAYAVAGGNYEGGMLTDGGNNLSSDGTVPFTASSSITNTDPLLLSLTNNGGPTWTMVLVANSPAIDAGQTIPGLTVDQRGDPRPSGKAFDIGAFEYQQLVTAIDAGLRAYDGTSVIVLAAQYPATTNSPLCFRNNGTNYGVVLTSTNSASASKFRVQTSTGVMSLMKLH